MSMSIKSQNLIINDKELTPEEFMRRCIHHGKVIYSEINSIPVDKS